VYGPTRVFLRAELRHTVKPAPILILYDNDDGAAAINKALKNSFKVTITGAEPFVHLTKNVYALAAPKGVGATQSRIEDYFKPATKAIIYEGKTFNDAKSL